MTTIIELHGFDFNPLFSSEKALNSLTPMSQDLFSGTLRLTDAGATLLLRDAHVHATIDIPCSVEVQEYTEPRELKLEYQKLLYVLKSYSDADRAQVRLVFQHNTTTEETSLTLFTDNDTLQIPHRLTAVIDPEPQSQSGTDIWNSAISDVSVFIRGIATCLQFISTDEKKHNAVAVFPDKLIVNDRRHIIVVNGVMNTCPVNAKGYMAMHKKIAKLITLLPDITSVQVDNDATEFIIHTNNGLFIAKNTSSNIAPPSSDQLKGLIPTCQALKINKAQLIAAVDFFKGFYTATGDWNPITISSDGQVCKLLLKNSGSGFGSYAVERALQPAELDSDPFEVTVINDSLRQFLGKVSAEELIVYIDETSPAVFISSEDLEVYLVKLV